MIIKPQVNHADSVAGQEDDLLTASEKYMRNEMSIGQLRDVQHLHARNLKAVALKLAGVEQSNQALPSVKNASESREKPGALPEETALS